MKARKVRGGARIDGWLTEHALRSGLAEQYASIHGGRRVGVTLRWERDREQFVVTRVERDSMSGTLYATSQTEHGADVAAAREQFQRAIAQTIKH